MTSNTEAVKQQTDPKRLPSIVEVGTGTKGADESVAELRQHERDSTSHWLALALNSEVGHRQRM